MMQAHDTLLHVIAMNGTSDRLCWLAESWKILLLVLRVECLKHTS